MASSSSYTSSASVALLLVTITTLTSLFVQTTATGSFTVDFIRRDSPLSPFHNSSQTHHDRLNAAIQRSSENEQIFRSSKSRAENSNPIVSTITPNNNFEYLMRVLIGTPPVEILGIADTGSDLIWTNCKPCNDCYTQSSPLFDPSSSRTYRNLSCSSGSCSFLEDPSCGAQQECRFKYSYSDKSHSAGVLSSETMTFSSVSRRPVLIPNITFGCAHQSGGLYNLLVAGVVGLGGGPLSLISQLGPSIDNKFSYCLVPFSDVNSSSTFTFGSAATVTGPNIVSTPISTDQLQPTFFQIRLDSIHVGTNSVLAPINLIVDSGTTFTFLPKDVLNSLITSVSEVVTSNRTTDPDNFFELCYDISSGEIKLPDVKLVLRNNAVLTLPSSNTFVQKSETVVCLAISAGNIPILGNFAQQNFIVEYDVGMGVMSFAPRDCTKY